MPLPACVQDEIGAAVQQLARQYNVSKSWVIATVLADAFGVKIERYDEVRRLRKARDSKLFRKDRK